MLDLGPIKQRIEAASDGPWFVIHHPEWPGGKSRVDNKPETKHAHFGELAFMERRNAEFVANIRQDAPAMVTEIEKNRKRIAELEGGLAKAEDMLRQAAKERIELAMGETAHGR